MKQWNRQPVDTEADTTSFDPREVIKSYLERERQDWLPHYKRATRDGRMNASLNANADLYMPKINELLDELHALGATAVKGASDEQVA